MRVQRNTLYKAGRRGTPGRAMRRRRREEGGELIESEQRISGMAYSSSGSLLLFFFLPACLLSLSLSFSLSLSALLPPVPFFFFYRVSLALPRAVLRSSLYPLRTGYRGGSVGGRTPEDGGRKHSFVSARTDLDHIVYNVYNVHKEMCNYVKSQLGRVAPKYYRVLGSQRQVGEEFQAEVLEELRTCNFLFRRYIIRDTHSVMSFSSNLISIAIWMTII